MPILLAGHYYVNKKPKESRFINEIIPQSDIEVSQVMFDSFEDKTRAKEPIVDDRVFCRDVLRDVLEATGAPR